MIIKQGKIETQSARWVSALASTSAVPASDDRLRGLHKTWSFAGHNELQIVIRKLQSVNQESRRVNDHPEGLGELRMLADTPLMEVLTTD